MQEQIDQLGALIGRGETASAALALSGFGRREFSRAPRGYYLYLLVDPMDDAVFYVGKGKGYRAQQHARNERAGSELNPLKAERLFQIRSAGKAVEVLVVCDGLAEADAYRYERDIIEAAKLRLTNISGGQVTGFSRLQSCVRRSLAIFESAVDGPDGEAARSLAETCKRLLLARPSEAEIIKQDAEMKRQQAESARVIAMLNARVDTALTQAVRI